VCGGRDYNIKVCQQPYVMLYKTLNSIRKPFSKGICGQLPKVANQVAEPRHLVISLDSVIVAC